MKVINIVQDLISIFLASAAQPSVQDWLLSNVEGDIGFFMNGYWLLTYFIVGISFIHVRDAYVEWSMTRQRNAQSKGKTYQPQQQQQQQSKDGKNASN